jgi:hypothetical protein
MRCFFSKAKNSTNQGQVQNGIMKQYKVTKDNITTNQVLEYISAVSVIDPLAILDLCCLVPSQQLLVVYSELYISGAEMLLMAVVHDDGMIPA